MELFCRGEVFFQRLPLCSHQAAAKSIGAPPGRGEKRIGNVRRCPLSKGCKRQQIELLVLIASLGCAFFSHCKQAGSREEGERLIDCILICVCIFFLFPAAKEVLDWHKVWRNAVTSAQKAGAAASDLLRLPKGTRRAKVPSTRTERLRLLGSERGSGGDTSTAVGGARRACTHSPCLPASQPARG